MDLGSIIPQFGGFFSTILAFVVALSVIVAVHEYGHYIVGRWCGIKAKVFSLGFGPVLWSRMDRHGTQWQFALLPFGGYVKFMGDATASSGTSDESYSSMTPQERRATMQGAPLWARTATVAAGPAFNFVSSILIFAGILIAQGQDKDPLTIGAVLPLPTEGITLQSGDELTKISGVEIPDFSDENQSFDDFLDELPKQSLLDYDVVRDGEKMTVQGPFPLPVRVNRLAPQSAAYNIDMQQGDVIVAVDGQPIIAFSDLKDIVEGSNGKVLQLKVWRDGDVLDFALAPKRVDEPQSEGGFKTNWRIGISSGLAFELAKEPLNPGAAALAGATQTWLVIENSFSGLYHMVTGAISSCNMSGPIGIAQVSGAMASQGAESFIWFIAVLSTAVGLLNLFPVPVLDGGHLMFYAYEAVSGKPPSDRALNIMMTIGLVLILTLMTFALGNDIFCP